MKLMIQSILAAAIAAAVFLAATANSSPNIRLRISLKAATVFMELPRDFSVEARNGACHEYLRALSARKPLQARLEMLNGVLSHISTSDRNNTQIYGSLFQPTGDTEGKSASSETPKCVGKDGQNTKCEQKDSVVKDDVACPDRSKVTLWCDMHCGGKNNDGK